MTPETNAVIEVGNDGRLDQSDQCPVAEVSILKVEATGSRLKVLFHELQSSL